MTRSNWSVPETEVVQSIRERLDERAAGADGPPDVLATVVGVEGNAYRRPGAKMVLSADGEGIGAITAGCLEEDLVSVADRIRETGRPEVVTYDLMDDEEEDVWGLGVGCNGVIDVLVEPLTETYRPAVEAFGAGRDVAVLTVLDGGDGALADGDRAYYRPDDGTLRTPEGDPATDWPDSLSDPAGALADRGRGDTLVVDDRAGGTVEVFVDGIAAPTELVVFGTGHDVGPVTELAARNDFRVTVVGFRGAVDLDDRFPEADRTVTTSPANVDEALAPDERTHAVVMTHNFVDDRLVVESLLDAGVAYVGLMGPRERFEEMLEEFAAEGRTFDESELEPLYTPVGLDLGGGSPYQIAHSIVAEVLAVANDRRPGHLKAREGPIHERVDVGDGDDEGDGESDGTADDEGNNGTADGADEPDARAR
ncbi:XdhC/CoxI family protein [Halobaculum sp. WSA2]|uniref:XdhC/CoxI family protein n=1 Tax=Halobaculum saliterrae TaxID=2073113 RepID=A0A6B0SQW9_9EURY|nr:XdhC/CoxI family protein [Halobaculum saliterrae]MXR41045.1 XdhC/CoxI family protein [Halobaculum saliterrae]